MAVHNTLAPGTMLRQYRIEKVIGQGGFGITYLATDTDLDRKVAIKECFPRDFVSRDGTTVIPTSANTKTDFNWALDKFVTEATTLAKFRHPGIVQVLQIIKDENGSAYMVLEFVEGQDFDSWLKKLPGTPSENQLSSIIRPLIEALEVVHRNKFTHRDIAPDNIYIRNNGQAVLLDFGAAKLNLGNQSKTLNLVVKDGYSAPEQYYAEGRQGPWTDIYAFAATIYRAISSKRPIDAMARLDAINNGEPDPLIPLSEVAPSGYSKRFLAAVDRGLSPQVKNRPQTISDWSDALFIEAPSAPAKPSPQTEIRNAKEQSVSSRERGGKSRLPLVAAAVILIAAAIGGYQYYASVVKDGATQAAESAWLAANADDTKAAYDKFITEHGDSGRRRDAEAALTALETPWQKTFGGSGSDVAFALAANGARGIFVAGHTAGNSGGQSAGWIASLSHSGKLRWEKRYDKGTSSSFSAIVSTSDGGVIAAGEIEGKGRGGNDGIIVRYGPDGAIKWERTFGGARNDGLSSLAVLSDGRLIAAGSTESSGSGQSDGWILRLSDSGELISQQTMGDEAADEFSGAVVLGGGDLLFVGSAVPREGEQPRFWLVRMTPEGAVRFDRKPGGTAIDRFNSVTAAPDGGAFIAGETRSFGTNSFDGMAMRLMPDNKLPPRALPAGGDQHLNAVAFASNGSVLLAGRNVSKQNGSDEAWVVSYSSDLKTRNWERLIGLSGFDEANAILAEENGTAIVAGTTEANGKDIWVARIRAQ